MKIILVVIVVLAAFAVTIPFYLMWINMKPEKGDGGATPAPSDLGLPYETLYLVSADGVPIRAWLIQGETGAPCVIMVHGKGCAKNGLLTLAAALHKDGYHILLPDLRGHGESGDARITFGLNEKLDLQVAADALKRRPQIDATRLGVYAQSMGSAAAVQALAERHDVRGFVLDSSFDNLSTLLSDVAVGIYHLPRPFGALGRVAYFVFSGSPPSAVDNAALLARYPHPCLFFHVTGDQTIPIARARALFAASAGPKLFLETGGDAHAGSWAHDPAHFEAAMREFFREIFAKGDVDMNRVETAYRDPIADTSAHTSRNR